MQVAELFVNLGLVGSDKTKEGLDNVEKGLHGVSSVALETKIALVAAFYALQQLFSASGKQGTELTNFNLLLGEGTKTLQQYQYALRQTGISNEETENTFKNLSSTFTKVKYNLGSRPVGLAQVAKFTGGNIGQAELTEYAKHSEKFIKRFQEYLKKETDIGLANEVGRSFGFSDSFMAGLRRANLTQGNLNKAPTYSDREISQLDKSNIAWLNIGNSIQMAVGHVNAQYGVQLTTDIDHITKSVERLVLTFLKLDSVIHIFDAISYSVDGLTELINGLTDVLKYIGAIPAEGEGKKAKGAGKKAKGAGKGGKEKPPSISKSIENTIGGGYLSAVNVVHALNPLNFSNPTTGPNADYAKAEGLDTVKEALKSMLDLYLHINPITAPFLKERKSDEHVKENTSISKPLALSTVKDHTPSPSTHITNHITQNNNNHQTVHVSKSNASAGDINKEIEKANTKVHRDALRQMHSLVRLS